MVPVITIDGPSGAGKGTISRLLAQKLGYQLLDSGALYRLTGLACELNGADIDNEDHAAEQAAQLNVEFQVLGDTTRITLGEKDVSAMIREERVGMLASKVAAYPKVRAALLERQRQFRQPPGLIADGRDMGTVVFPDSPFKFFLTASAEERAHRRLLQLGETENNKEMYQKILADIHARDEKDSSRSAAPLMPAEDAVQIDCTHLDIDAVLQIVLNQIEL